MIPLVIHNSPVDAGNSPASTTHVYSQYQRIVSTRNMTDSYRPPGGQGGCDRLFAADTYRPQYNPDSTARTGTSFSYSRRARRGRGQCRASVLSDPRRENDSHYAHSDNGHTKRKNSPTREQPTITVQKLPADHPLAKELDELKKVRSDRRNQWVRLARRLGPDWDLPNCQDRLQFRYEEELADRRLQDLAAMVALEERALLMNDPEFGPLRPVFSGKSSGSRYIPDGKRRRCTPFSAKKDEVNKRNSKQDDVEAWMVSAGNLAATAKQRGDVPLFIGDSDSDETMFETADGDDDDSVKKLTDTNQEVVGAQKTKPISISSESESESAQNPASSLSSQSRSIVLEPAKSITVRLPQPPIIPLIVLDDEEDPCPHNTVSGALLGASWLNCKSSKFQNPNVLATRGRTRPETTCSREETPRASRKIGSGDDARSAGNEDGKLAETETIKTNGKQVLMMANFAILPGC